jgi:septum formation protein
MPMNTPIILASNSPRRRELLRQIGVVFSSDAADIDERVLPGEQPDVYAVRTALEKAQAVSARTGSGIVIAADTVVVLDGVIMGKPTDGREAERMLSMLSGKMHRVLTGLAIVDAGTGKTRTRVADTRVWFRPLTHDQITSYVGSGEPLDKAGAYGIQGKGALLIDRIEGCYFNVVGLPLSLLAEMLIDFGIRLL